MFMPSAKEVWYFAYGSNMSAATFQGGRGINPIATVPARIHGWTLVFDIGGIPYKDPAFSSIAPISIFPHGLGNSEKQMEVCGVAYLVTLEDYIQIIASEGGGITYREVQLLAEPLYQLTREAGLHLTELPVMTLVTEFGCSPPRCPSLRYKEIMVQGAKELLLPGSYFEHLKDLKHYHEPKSKTARLGAAIFLAIWVPIMSGAEGLTKFSANFDGRGNVPEFVRIVVRLILRIMWLHHDAIHAPLWGRGDGLENEAGCIV